MPGVAESAPPTRLREERMPLKVMTWNLEHADRLAVPNPSPQIQDRLQRVRALLEDVDPDVLCLQEGPKGEKAVDSFATQALGDTRRPVLLRGPADALGDRDGDYDTKGAQWIWFLVKPALLPKCRLQPPSTWQAFTGSRSWKVHPWGKLEPESHSHYRHPQVLLLDIGGGHIAELIGVHLKSKINREKIERDAQGNLLGTYLDEAMEARIKLATEARDVRRYLDAKFDQSAAPAILVMGDCNDGPGHDFFETSYLFFDLIGNLQGEVLVAERFFNHALFDFPGHLRWSARYEDDVLKIPAGQNPLLLDHILISQPLCRKQLPLVANEHAGKVEHEAYERANAGSNSTTRTSDHRPVTCVLDDASG
jgi:endonuclease/exonuclease/phosphatase family metal-dependent hydrolase